MGRAPVVVVDFPMFRLVYRGMTVSAGMKIRRSESSCLASASLSRQFLKRYAKEILHVSEPPLRFRNRGRADRSVEKVTRNEDLTRVDFLTS